MHSFVGGVLADEISMLKLHFIWICCVSWGNNFLHHFIRGVPPNICFEKKKKQSVITWMPFRVKHFPGFSPPINNHTSLARFICSHLFLSTREYGSRFYLSLTHIQRYWIFTREKNGLSFSNCLNYLWTRFDRICISFKWYDWKWVNKIQIFKQPYAEPCI